MSDNDLDAVLSNFTGQVRKRDGSRYPGKTIHEIITSLQKYFQIQGKNVRLIDVNKFPTLYYALDVAMKQSATAGIGMDTRKALAISKEQECRLFELGILGNTTPLSLVRSVFYMIGLHFGIRGGKEHRNLNINNFTILHDLGGKEYIQYTERVSKTNQGGLRH